MRAQREFFQDEVGPMVDIVFVGCNLAEAAAPLAPAGGAGGAPDRCTGPVLKKRPTEYLRDLYFDSIVFTSEALRHLVAECGASQIVMGTDYPYPWTSTAVEHILETPSLSDAERAAILGDNACKLLGIAS